MSIISDKTCMHVLFMCRKVFLWLFSSGFASPQYGYVVENRRETAATLLLVLHKRRIFMLTMLVGKARFT